MAARLAWAPPPWREVAAWLTIVAIIAFFAWLTWGSMPAKGPQTHSTARIVRIIFVPGYKAQPASASIDIEYADGRRDSLSMHYDRVYRCQAGDEVSITGTPTNVSRPSLSIAPGSCGGLSR